MRALKTRNQKKSKSVNPKPTISRKTKIQAVSGTKEKPVGFKEIYRHVKRIPKGKVATYGDIALLCDERISARVVGWALNVCPKDIPWHRVISSTGWLSVGRRSVLHQEIQRGLLQSEGVEFSAEFTVALDRFRWQPSKGRKSKQ